MKRYILITVLICGNFVSGNANVQSIVCGAERTDQYLPLLQGKRVGVVANQTSVIGKVHLVDTLRSLNVDIVKIFTPEHGFSGNVEAEGKVKSSIDERIGLQIVSLYGQKVKPSKEDLQGIDILLFDIQDVGCRFYTYISTLHYVMEAATENNISLILLDRPNPNGFYIAGCVLKDISLVSFVGMHSVPIVYGMTIGEYAQMINGEHWLGTSSKRVVGEKGILQCNLTIIPLQNYTHDSLYEVPIPPSPNLRTNGAIMLYPTLCLFEGTPISVGRGTDAPFEIVGYPECKLEDANVEFTPRAIKGVSDKPPYKDTLCKGFHIDGYIGEISVFGGLMDGMPEITELKFENSEYFFVFDLIKWLYNDYPIKDKFFQPFFDKLAGTKELKEVIKGNIKFKDVEDKWTKDLYNFSLIRKQYLLYEDFTNN
jgi:uncharacterized protein YbbC (DUF1343 family)